MGVQVGKDLTTGSLTMSEYIVEQIELFFSSSFLGRGHKGGEFKKN